MKRTDKRHKGIHRENKKLEREIEELEDALLLHKHIHHVEDSDVRTVLRNEIGGSRWEYGGGGKLKTFKSSRDLDPTYGLDTPGGKQTDKMKGKMKEEAKQEPQLIKVGSGRSSARTRRDRQRKESKEQPQKDTQKQRKDNAGDEISPESSPDYNELLFPNNLLKIDNLKDKVLQKVSANVIHRPPVPDDVARVPSMDKHFHGNDPGRVKERESESERSVKSRMDISSGKRSSDNRKAEKAKSASTASDRNSNPSSGSARTIGSAGKTRSNDKKSLEDTNQTKQQPNRRARESRHAAKSTIEDYVKLVSGAAPSNKESSSWTLSDKTSVKNPNVETLDLVGRKPAGNPIGAEVLNIIDEVEKVNLNDGPAELGGPSSGFASIREPSSLKRGKGPSREVLTSDYSSDLETSPDRWDEPHIGGASFDRESWLYSLQKDIAKYDDSRVKQRAPAPSDDASDTPVLGAMRLEAKHHYDRDNVMSSSSLCDPDVVLWLENLNLRDCSRYIGIFAENEIDMDGLKDLSTTQLNLMGITAVGPVNKILRAVDSLKDEEELMSMVGADEKQSSRDARSSRNLTGNTSVRQGKIGEKKMFSFSDFAGVEGKDEIKKKLQEQNQKTVSVAAELAKINDDVSDGVDKDDVVVDAAKNTSVLRRQTSLSSRRDSRGAKSNEQTKTSEARPKLLRRRSSSASRIQSDRDRSLSSESGNRGQQPSQRPVQNVPKGLPSGKKPANQTESKARSKRQGDGDNQSGSKANKKPGDGIQVETKPKTKTRPKPKPEVLRRTAEAGISAAAQKREELSQRTKREMVDQRHLQDGRKKRRDVMAAKHLGRRPDSKGSLQPTTRLTDMDLDPLEHFTLPDFPENPGNYPESSTDSELEDILIKVDAIKRKSPKSENSARISESSTKRSDTSARSEKSEESLTAREKIKNVDSMVRDLQKKSVGKQNMTLSIVRDLQKQLEDIEKTLVNTDDDIQILPESANQSRTSQNNNSIPVDASSRLNKDLRTYQNEQHVHSEDIPSVKTPVNPTERPKTAGASRLVPSSIDIKMEEAEKKDALAELISRKSKGSMVSEANVGQSGQSSRSKGQPMGVASMSMSKRELLDEIRKEKNEHRKEIRHLKSELTRLQHKDPVKKEELDIRDINLMEDDLIGEGAFSQVFRGRYQGADVAVKRLKVPLSSQDKNYFAAEVSLLRDLRHPRVVLLLGVCTSKRLPIMVLEFMSKGNLFGLLHNPQRESLDHAEYYQIARDIAAGMLYLHNHRPSVLHLDLKSMNVLIGPMDRAKIADFGFSKLKHDADQKAAKNNKAKEQIQGSPAWMAPELLQAGEVTPKADVFSFGVILWEMLTRQVPYEGCSMFQILEKVRLNKRPEIPPECPDALSQFVSRCWDQNQAKRPTFKEILSTLENLSFPPEWRELFQQAGVPREALENVQSTRNIISLVTSTLESTKLASLIDSANQGEGDSEEIDEELDEESESTSIEGDADSEGTLSEDSLESDMKESSVSSSRVSSSRVSSASTGEKPHHQLPVSDLNPYSYTTHKKDRDQDNTLVKTMAVINPTASDPTVTITSPVDEFSKEKRFCSEMSDSPILVPEASDNVKRLKPKRNRAVSPESAISKYSQLPTPRRSREAWSSEDIPVPVPAAEFPHNHIPPPPAPPPPPPPMVPTLKTLHKSKSSKSKSSSPKSETQPHFAPSFLVTPQALEARSKKLKTSKRSNGRPHVTPKPIRSGLFAVGVSDLVQQRGKLKPTIQTHPNQLEDLAQVNKVMLSSIAEILRDAMSERRFAMGEDPSASCDLEHTQSDLSWSTQDD